MQLALSDYVDGALSARRTWQVEKHLAECGECAAAAHLVRATVDALHAAPLYDTGGDFMAKLHARLDGLEPEPPAARTLVEAFKDWWMGLREPMQVQRVPAIGLALAAAALVGMVLLNQPAGDVTAPVVITRDQLHRDVALTASNPFDDPVAATLDANASNGATVDSLQE